jgi:hypothetical protein
MPKEVAFEPKAEVREVAVTLPGGRGLRIKKGKQHVTSDPAEIAVLDAAEGAKRAKQKKPAQTRSAKSAGVQTPPSKES